MEDSTDETRGDSKKTITVGGIDKKESSGGFSFRRKPNQPPPVTQVCEHSLLSGKSNEADLCCYLSAEHLC